MSPAVAVASHGVTTVSVPLTAVVCPGCGGGGLESQGPLRVGWTATVSGLFQCGDCGCAVVDPMPGLEDLHGLYDQGLYRLQGGYAAYEARQLPVLSGMVHRALAALPGHQGARLLDLGCGSGLLLQAAAAAGLETWGIDASPRDVAEARARPGVLADRVQCGWIDVADGPLDALAASQPGRFDLVMAVDLLEHLRDPGAVMKSVAQLLRPGGLVLAVTGNLQSAAAQRAGNSWDYLSREGHVCFFTPSGVTRLVQRSGLSLETLETSLVPGGYDRRLASWGVPVSSLRGVVNRYSVGRLAKAALRRLVEARRQTDPGEAMVVMARRPVSIPGVRVIDDVDGDPAVAAVIPNARGWPSALLGDLSRQSLKPGRVVVVTGESPNGRARNRGVESALSGGTAVEALVFIDDDARLSNSKVVERLVAPIRQQLGPLGPGSVAVAGGAKLLPPGASRLQRRIAAEVPRAVEPDPVGSEPFESNPGLQRARLSGVTTTCCAMAPQALAQAGGFSDDLVRGVDSECFYRLRKLGYRFLLVPGAASHHPVPDSVAELLALWYQRGRGHAVESARWPRRGLGPRLSNGLAAGAWLALRSLALLPMTLLRVSRFERGVRFQVRPLGALASFAAALGYVKASR